MLAPRSDLASVLRPPRRMSLHEPSPRAAILLFAFTAAACALVAAIAWWSGEPLFFPALGATTFIVFWAPEQPAAAPRNALGAHVAGAIVGWLAFRYLGPSSPFGGGSATWLSKIAAPALALGVTSVVMLLARLPHPPAGATTLIFATGLLARPTDIAAIGSGVLCVAGLAWCAHRLTGRNYPLWSARRGPSLPSHGRPLQ